MIKVLSFPKFRLNLTLAGWPTSKAILVLSVWKFTSSVTTHCHVPKSDTCTSFNSMSQFVRLPFKVILFPPSSSSQIFWGLLSWFCCKAHCLLPLGPRHTQKNHCILVPQLRVTLWPGREKNQYKLCFSFFNRWNRYWYLTIFFHYLHF